MSPHHLRLISIKPIFFLTQAGVASFQQRRRPTKYNNNNTISVFFSRPPVENNERKQLFNGSGVVILDEVG